MRVAVSQCGIGRWPMSDWRAANATRFAAWVGAAYSCCNKGKVSAFPAAKYL